MESVRYVNCLFFLSKVSTECEVWGYLWCSFLLCGGAVAVSVLGPWGNIDLQILGEGE
jgi:hypothetical protein